LAVLAVLAELLRKADAEPDLDTLREGVRVLTQALMELEVAQHLGAERYPRSPERQGERNGYRERSWDTRVGTLDLKVPRVRDGSFFPSLLDPRKRAERALVATVREAYVQGVSTRRVDTLVKALGLDGISKSQVSVLCQELDTESPATACPATSSCWQSAMTCSGAPRPSALPASWPTAAST